MTDLTLENITKLIKEMKKSAGGEPNLMIFRCPSCNVLYSYGYIGENPNIKTEDHKEDCYFRQFD